METLTIPEEKVMTGSVPERLNVQMFEALPPAPQVSRLCLGGIQGNRGITGSTIPIGHIDAAPSATVREATKAPDELSAGNPAAARSKTSILPSSSASPIWSWS